MTAVSQTAAAFAGAVFAAAAIAKAKQSAETATFLQNLGFGRAARRVAAVVPSAEGLLALGLLSGVGNPVALPAGAIIATAFLAIQIRTAFSPDAPSCRCFGALDVGDVAAVRVGRAAALAVGLFIAFPQGVRAPFVHTPSVGAIAAGVTIALSLLLGSMLVERIADFQRWRPRRSEA